MTVLSPTLKRLFLANIPSLVELPCSFSNLKNLDYLGITDCINLETLPTGINFQNLCDLNLTGCTRLRTFPDISTNISYLFLTRTGIEEVPWWIKNFCRLEYLFMHGCNKLQCVSLHLSKLKRLHSVEFSDCVALTEANWNDSSSAVEIATDNASYSKLPVLDKAFSSFPDNFINCFNFDQETLLQR